MNSPARATWFKFALALILLAGCSASTTAPPAKGKGAKGKAAAAPAAKDSVTCVVASVHPLATDAGVAAFEAGGNAVDAAIATGLTLGVVDTANSGIGGGCFILIRKADGTIIAIDGREKAPAAATRDMFIRDGKADTSLSQVGPLAVGVPGALAAYQLALNQCGNLKLKDLIDPAAKIAEDGFPIDRVYAAKLASHAEVLGKFAGTRAILLKGDKSPWPKGHKLVQADLAKTYRAIGADGIDWFYRGPFAQKVSEWMKDNGGVLTAEDFAAYEPFEREPIKSTYRGLTIVGFPPPSSGGVHVAQMLNMLEEFDMQAEYKKNPARALSIVAQAMDLAFADRAFWLGDPDFAKVPRGLADREYAAALAKRIDPEHAVDVESHGEPPKADAEFFGEKHTTHIAAADSEGNWVAMTQTINLTFGSKVIVPGTGVMLNDEMDDFSAQPGVPNGFGLIGGENNAVAPGKRPLSSMTPTIVLKDDKPVMTVGAAGGPKIITQVLQALVRRIDFGQALAEAVGSPRIHHQWRPDVLTVEEAMPAEVVKQLEGFGFKIEKVDFAGVTQAVEVDDQGKLSGVYDPRVPGKAAGGERAAAR